MKNAMVDETNVLCERRVPTRIEIQADNDLKCKILPRVKKECEESARIPMQYRSKQQPDKE